MDDPQDRNDKAGSGMSALLTHQIQCGRVGQLCVVPASQRQHSQSCIPRRLEYSHMKMQAHRRGDTYMHQCMCMQRKQTTGHTRRRTRTRAARALARSPSRMVRAHTRARSR
eukprot:5693649-Pleurochrysis_carterae.AAC.7